VRFSRCDGLPGSPSAIHPFPFQPVLNKLLSRKASGLLDGFCAADLPNEILSIIPPLCVHFHSHLLIINIRISVLQCTQL
jgi:hypothetical protein